MHVGDASSRTSLGSLTTNEAKLLLEAGLVVIVPLGSVEPHGPHLPLSTDAIISEGASARAVAVLAARGVVARVAPTIPYAVTDFAQGFAGAVSIPGEALTAFLDAVAAAFLRAGALHVCFVNNHLEPAQDMAVRKSARAPTVSVACPLTRRWARTLSDEFKRGACHAGRYETSLVLAADPAQVRSDALHSLPAVPISLSEGIRDGKSTFVDMGMSEAYAGAPAEATAPEGEAQFELLAEMISTEIIESMALGSGDVR